MDGSPFGSRGEFLYTGDTGGDRTPLLSIARGCSGNGEGAVELILQERMEGRGWRIEKKFVKQQFET
jgi:hypothetical protein